MDTLAQKYDSLIKTNEWKYYDFPQQTTNIIDESSKNFIVSYFGKGSKTEASIFKYIESLEEYRIKHILSSFLLGVIVYEESTILQENIDGFLKKIPSDREESSKERFLYIWMLVSIFHDFGYAVEEKKVDIEIDEFDSLLEQMPDCPKGVPELYDKSLLKSYNTFKCCHFSCYDHGIVGGIKLYSDLCKLREEKERKNNYNDTNCYWGEDLENDFSIAAWAIACHNIFYDKGNTAYTSCYKQLGLENLICSNDKEKYLIKIDRHPIFYLLCLVDSIEPIKTFKMYDALKKVKLGVDTNQIKIQVDAACALCGSDICQSKIEVYFNKAIALNNWLAKTTKSGNTLTIYL